MPPIKNIIALCIGLLALCSCDTETDEGTEMCFVGDSITDVWDVEHQFTGRYIHKFAVKGSKIEDALQWDTKICNGHPTVLLIGTNNIPYLGKPEDSLSFTPNKDFYADYSRLIKKIDPSELHAISILPRRIKFKEDPQIIKLIAEVNDSLQQVLKETDIKSNFINAYPEFLNEDGSLKNEYFVDGIHLNAEGYEVLSAIVRKKI